MPIPVFDKQNKLYFIEVDDVISLKREMMMRRIVITTNKCLYYLPTTLDQTALILEEYGFVKIDKNKIINIHKVSNYDKNSVTVEGINYPISRRRKKHFDKKIAELHDNDRSRYTNGQK